MRYSILGFNQERVLSLTAVVEKSNGEFVTLSLDLEDLLIMQILADFPNRTKVKKIIKDDKVFFWASYNEILSELPILNIKKQALAKRLDKLEKLHILERDFLTADKRSNMTFFSLTSTYESLLYDTDGIPQSEDTPSRIQVGDPLVSEYDTLSYLNMGPSRTEIRDVNNNTIDNNTEIEKKDNTPPLSLQGDMDGLLAEVKAMREQMTNLKKENDELKEKKSKKSESAFDVRADLTYVDVKYLSIWNEWLDYKDSIKKQYKTQVGAKKAYANFMNISANSIDKARAIVDQAQIKSWDGLYDIKDWKESMPQQQQLQTKPGVVIIGGKEWQK